MENTDKKMTIKALIEKGKANNGKISTQDIDAAILEMDFDIEELAGYGRPGQGLS